MTKLLLNRDLLKLTLFTLLKPVAILGILHIVNLLWDIEEFGNAHPVGGFIVAAIVAICGAYVFIGIPVLFPEKFSDLQDSGLCILIPLTTSSFVVGGALLLLVVQAIWKYIKGLALIAIAIILSVYTGIFLLIFMLIINGIVKKGICKEKTHDRYRNIFHALYDKDLDFAFIDSLMDRFSKLKCI